MGRRKFSTLPTEVPIVFLPSRLFVLRLQCFQPFPPAFAPFPIIRPVKLRSSAKTRRAIDFSQGITWHGFGFAASFLSSSWNAAKEFTADYRAIIVIVLKSISALVCTPARRQRPTNGYDNKYFRRRVQFSSLAAEPDAPENGKRPGDCRLPCVRVEGKTICALELMRCNSCYSLALISLLVPGPPSRACCMLKWSDYRRLNDNDISSRRRFHSATAQWARLIGNISGSGAESPGRREETRDGDK